jgi:hypothetical protein
MAKVIVKPCSCKSEYQDATYGKGLRVHNVKGDSTNKDNGATCTVCANGGRKASK